MSYDDQDTRVFEKACDFVEVILNNGRTFDHMIRAVRRAWVYVHETKCADARQDVQRTVQP